MENENKEQMQQQPTGEASFTIDVTDETMTAPPEEEMEQEKEQQQETEQTEEKQTEQKEKEEKTEKEQPPETEEKETEDTQDGEKSKDSDKETETKEEKEKEQKEETSTDENVETKQQEEKTEEDKQPTVEELQKQIKEYKDEQEVREQVMTFAKIKQQEEKGFNEFCQRLNENYIATLKKYGIDVDKTIEELKAEDPTKAEIATQITAQAQKIREDKAREITNTIDQEFHKVVFKKAEKVFAKFNLTKEQEEAAAKDFVRIVREVGVQNIDEDVVEKVKYSVAKAMMEHPKEAEKIAPATPEEIKEVVDKIADTTEDKTETQQQEEQQGTQENKKSTEPKIEIDEFREGVIDSTTGGTTANKADEITVDNVLDRLASLNYFERTKFYTEHFDLIEKAAKMAQAKLDGVDYKSK